MFAPLIVKAGHKPAAGSGYKKRAALSRIISAGEWKEIFLTGVDFPDFGDYNIFRVDEA